MNNFEKPITQEVESNGGISRPERIPNYEEGGQIPLYDDENFEKGYKEASLQAQIKLEDGKIEEILNKRKLIIESINGNLNADEGDIDEGMNRYGQLRAIRDLMEANPVNFQ